MSALRGLSEPHVWVGWPGAAVPESSEAEVVEALERRGPVPGVPHGRRGRGLLHPHVQRDDLAALPLLRRAASLLRRCLGELRRRERALRRHDREHRRARGPRLGPRLPPCAPARRRFARAGRISRSASSFTSPSRPPRSTDCFRRAASFCVGSSALTTSASTPATTSVTSARRACGSSGWSPSRGRSPSTGAIVGIGAHPIGIDVETFRTTLADPETARMGAELEQRYQGKQIVLGIERLDYTKGIPEKLDAFERILELEPERALTTTLVQVLVPSRLESTDYYGQARRDRAAGRAPERALRRVRDDARRVSAPLDLDAGARGSLPAGGRDDGHAAQRRDEPRRAGVRALPERTRAGARTRGNAAPERVRRRRPGAAGRAARQPVGRGRPRRSPPAGAHARTERATETARPDGRAGRRARQPYLGSHVPRAPRALRLRAEAALPRTARRRGSSPDRRHARRRPPPHVPARLRRDDARARDASGSRRADDGDPRAAPAACDASPRRRAHHQRPHARVARRLAGRPADQPLRRARRLRARGRTGHGAASSPPTSPGFRRPRSCSSGPPRRFPGASSSGRRRASPGTIARPSPSTASGARTSCSRRSANP